MAGTEDSAGLELNRQATENKGDTAAKGEDKTAAESQPETSRPLATPPNIFFLVYSIFLIFNITRNAAAAIRPESVGTVIGYLAMLFIPFAAVAAYNLAKGDARLLGKASVAITSIFLVFSMLVELKHATRTRQRLEATRGMADSLIAQRAAVPVSTQKTSPPQPVSNVESLAVPVKGSISLNMDPEPMKTVELADPAIARVAPMSPYELRITGLKAGTTSLNIQDRAGSRFAYEVNVE